MFMYGSLMKRPASHELVLLDHVCRTCPFVGKMPNASSSQLVIRAGSVRGGKCASASASLPSRRLTCSSSSSSRGLTLVASLPSVRIFHDATALRGRARARPSIVDPRSHQADLSDCELVPSRGPQTPAHSRFTQS